MAHNKFGISAGDEISKDKVVRHYKDPITEVILLFKGRKYGHVLMVLGLILFIAPTITKILFPLLVIIWLFCKPELLSMPLYVPAGSKQKVDPNDWVPSKKGRVQGKPAGVQYLGVTDDGDEVWNTIEKTRRHLLFLATTGGGKSVGLTTMTISGALVMGSGYSYTDGKAQLDLSIEHLSNAMRFNRALDFLMISYITGGQDIWGRTEHQMSNTFNPYYSSSYSDISELQKSLLDGDGDIWAKRAESFLSALTKVMVYRRDMGEIQLSVSSFIPYLSLEAVGKLAGRSDLPPVASSELVEFIRTIPGMTEASFSQLLKGQSPQSTTVYDQFGFITMQIIPLLNMLVGDYAFIFQCLIGQVSMKDCVLNRRILMVLLPALEKSPSSLANLGRISLAAQKSMMGSSLGSQFEGDVQTNIKNSATSASVPYLSINDEVGYYFVDGTAVAAAQSRSLFISMVYAAQDLPGMRRLSEMASKETDSVIGNTVTKLGGFLMDKQSVEMFKDQMGEAYTVEEDRKDIEKGGVFHGNQVANQVNTVRRNRVDIRDFNTLIEGEVYLQQQDRFFKVNMPQITAKELKITALNDFIPCPKFNPNELSILLDGVNQYSNAFIKILESGSKVEVNRGSESELLNINSDFLLAEKASVPNDLQAAGVFMIFLERLETEYNNIFTSSYAKASTPIEKPVEENDTNEKVEDQITADDNFDAQPFDSDTSNEFASDIEEEAEKTALDNKSLFANIFSSGLLDKEALSSDLEAINSLIQPQKSPEAIKSVTSKTIENIADVSGYPGKQRLKANPDLQLQLLKRLKKDLSNR
ncbi:hypothetical protein GCM10011607_11620 [Shewanella inventionis]|uniref:TraD/TraG TraM recognition site domain-containing protein n=1 Tax=Shewanella inventionis TaxID=1738770 RepID=A0ABQ1IW95_9GAMM|nr:hypothetical protein [Shewanella inventionis]GGB52794.1 hypothetical protein GCM10011607_11620 [Shewanella inventionis]